MLITSTRSSGNLGIALATWAGVLAIAVLTAAGCSVNVPRPDEEHPLATPRSEGVPDLRERPQNAGALEDERLDEAQTVERPCYLAAYYGALLRLPNEPLFWRGASQCDNDR